MIELSFDILKQALVKMEQNSYQNLCLLESSTTNPLAIYRYDVDDKRKYAFHKEFNKNAQLITFPKGQYLKFSFPININTPEDREEKRKNKGVSPYVTLQERGKQHRPSLESFVDGIKIPDDEVLLTIFDGGLDLYVPEIYFKNDSARINLIINKYKAIDRYLNFSQVSNGGTGTIFTVTDSRVELKEENIRLYKDGLKLQSEIDYELFISDRTLIISFKEDLGQSKIELCNSSHCIYRKEYEFKEDALVDFPKNILKDFPISIEIIEIYYQGKRLFIEDIESLTARHFKIKDFLKDSKVTITAYHDPSAMDGDYDYIDDILRYFNFKDRAEIVDILINNNYEGKIPKVPDYIQNIKFPPFHKPINNVRPSDEGKTYEEWIEDTLKEYIANNSGNLKYLLELLAGLGDFIFTNTNLNSQIRFDTAKEMGTFNYTKFNGPKVVYSIRTKDVTSFDILAFINDKKLFKQEVLYYTHMNTTYVYIDLHLIKEKDVTRMRLVPISNHNQMYDYINITPANLSEFFFVIPKEKLGLVNRPYDIIVMKKFEDGYKYLVYGEEYLVEKDELNNYRIYIGSRKLDDVYFVYNSAYYDYNISTFGESVEERMGFIYDKYDPTTETYLPKMSKYSHMIFVDRELFIEGLDYALTDQSNHPDIIKSKLSFLTIPEAGSQIEIYNYEQLRTQIGVVESVDSELGLIYLRDLPFPFSLKYMDLYVNGRKMTDNDIEILSDKLIRITNRDIKRPYHDVVVYTNLKVPSEDLEDYEDIYDKNPPKFDDWLEDDVIDEGLDLDDVLKPGFPEEPDMPIDPDYKPPVRISSLLNYVALMLRQGGISRRLDANNHLDFINRADFVEVMTDADIKNPEIALDTNKQNILEDTLIDCDSTMKTPEEISEIFGQHLKDGKIPSNLDFNDDIENYEQYEISQEVYEEELKLIDGHNLSDDDYLFDANSFDSDSPPDLEVSDLDITDFNHTLILDQETGALFEEYQLAKYPINSVLYVTVSGTMYSNQPNEIEYNKNTGKLLFKALRIRDTDEVVVYFNKSK